MHASYPSMNGQSSFGRQFFQLKYFETVHAKFPVKFKEKDMKAVCINSEHRFNAYLPRKIYVVDIWDQVADFESYGKFWTCEVFSMNKG